MKDELKFLLEVVVFALSMASILILFKVLQVVL